MGPGRLEESSNPAAATDPHGPAFSYYFHVPFCARKCEYCAFFSEPRLDLADRYTKALISEIELRAAPNPPATLFFGGGTPTLLSHRQWTRILSAIHNHYPSHTAEWTVECNPASLSLEKARLLHDAGVNRISMGVQSFNEDLLRRLGRIHDRKKIFGSFDTLRRAGFDNINLDLMFAIPGQSRSTWLDTLREALALGSEHLSAYEVTYEEDTPLFRQLLAGRIDVDEELASAMYEDLLEQATTHGFKQYEVANFSRSQESNADPLPSLACRHNITYWRGKPFLGLGPSACSFQNGVRLRNYADTRRYCESLEASQLPIESRDVLNPLDRAGEIAAFGLRMLIGWSFREFRETTGYDLRDHWSDAMAHLVDRGWAVATESDFRLTSTGLRFADAAAQYFLQPASPRRDAGL
jgi:oxygen-independent coproporphyrinogen-3 oxidase